LKKSIAIWIILLFLLSSLNPVVNSEQSKSSISNNEYHKEFCLFLFNSYVAMEVDLTSLNEPIPRGQSVMTIISVTYWTDIPEDFLRFIPWWIRNLILVGSITMPMQKLNFEIMDIPDWATISISSPDILVHIPFGGDRVEIENFLTISPHNDAPLELYSFEIQASCDDIGRIRGNDFAITISFTSGG